MLAEWARGVRSTLLDLPTGTGKCLGVGTPVLRFDGSTVAVEDVRVGDELMGPDSRPRRVLSTTRGHGALYRVTPARGTPWVCNDVHVLTLVHTETGAIVDVDLPTYLGETKWFRHLHKQFTPPDGIHFPDEESLPLDPYFLGIWYGDGTKALNGVMISKPDREILDACRAIAAKFGLRVRSERSGTNTCPTHHIVSSSCGPGTNPLLSLLRSIVGDATTIPHRYLTASRADRRELLAGLLDTDGHMRGSGFDFVQKRRGIAEGVCFLARSLGLRAILVDKHVNGVCYWRVSISGDCSVIPTRIPRKRAPGRRQIKCATRTGITVTPIAPGEYAGFELDGDGRFLLGDFTVTHNTVVFAEVARHFVEQGKRCLVLAHRSELLEQAQRKLRDVGVTAAIEQADKRAGRGVDVVVASVQTLRGKRLHKFGPDEFAAVIVDEAHHANAASYRAILAWFESALVLGVTATPKRGDGLALGDVFQSVAYRYPLQRAIADGYLVPIIARRVFVEAINLAGVRDRAKDLATDELAQAMATDEAVLGVVLPTLELVGDRRAIVFAVDVAHARALTVAICERKPGAARVAHGELSAEEREGLLVDFRRGRFQFLVNCALYTEGFDEPSVQAVVCARPTKSWALYTQMVGRGTRLLGATLAESIAAGKSDCLLVDVAGNSGRHKLVGPIDALAAGDVPDDVRREVERRLEDGETDLEDAIAEATAEVERRRKEMRAGASALYLAREVDPFLGDALGEPCTESWAGDPATQQDRVDLLNMGVKRIPERITRGEATRILRAEAARRAKGLASFKQLQVLRRCVDEKLLAKLTKSQASRRIAILAEVGWVPAAAAPRMRALEATEMLEAAKRSEEAQR